jgi:D-apiose dehydrogenase
MAAKELKFAFFGAGFWSHCQLGAWKEVEGARCVAIYNRTRAKAEKLAAEFDIPAVYSDPVELLDREQVDFVDIATSNDTHAALVKLVAGRKLPVICQKPLAPTLAEAEDMAAACRLAGVQLLVHENWRWQRPIRELKRVLDSGVIGHMVRATVNVISGVDDYVNQPFLKELEQLLLADMGIHLLDTTRFLFGEVDSLWCHNQRVQPDIRGEDLSTIMLRMHNGMTVVNSLALDRVPVEKDYYVQTIVFVEGQRGSVELGGDYWIRVTTSDGTTSHRYTPPSYPWADPIYGASMASIVPCHQNLLAQLRGDGAAETTVDDNLKTLRLVEACYRSAASGAVVNP